MKKIRILKLNRITINTLHIAKTFKHLKEVKSNLVSS
jgi:hypothetical protein